MSYNTITIPGSDNWVSSTLQGVLRFPNPVNEVAARMVAAMVFATASAIILFDIRWLMIFLAYGFIARVLTGPTMSPFGLLATRVIVPALKIPVKPTAGPPKQFAQFVGVVFSTTALVLTFGFGQFVYAEAVLGVLVFFAGLEAFAGFCMGCFVFGYLMKWGVIPEETCERCNNWVANLEIEVSRAA